MPRKNSTQMTDPGIKKLRKAPRGKRIEKFDAIAPGLSLRITDKGAKSWSVYYRLAGKHQRLTIGSWPMVGVAEAREQAGEIKDQAKAGVDPKMARARSAAEAQVATSKTFESIAESYIKRECSKLKRGQEYEAAIRRELVPRWGSYLVTDLRRLHLTELTDELLDANKPGAAHRAHEIAKRIFAWAVERGEVELSPFATAKPPVAKIKRDRVLKPGEIEALWSTWDAMGYPFGPLCKTLLLTAQRLREVAMMEWSEIDLDNALWVVPGQRTKNGLEMEVPISSLAMEIIGNLPRFTSGNFVFSTTGGARPVSGFSKMKARIDALTLETRQKEAERNDGDPGAVKSLKPWRLHDLRRTARTGLAELGVPEIVAEKVLNHSPRSVLVQTYNQYPYTTEKRDALERWAQKVREIITPPPDNVTRIRRSA